jgi:thiamine kinase-like enzyme
VYRYFSQSNGQGWPKSGYIVMEYIRGKVLGEDETPSNEQVKRIAQILHYFSTLQGDHPGPLEGGISLGLLWEENGKPVFKNMQQMEKWLNFRLPDVESKLCIMSYPLVLCHLDLAPRNFVWLADGSASLLDWSSAGRLTRNSLFVLYTLFLLPRQINRLTSLFAQASTHTSSKSAC